MTHRVRPRILLLCICFVTLLLVTACTQGDPIVGTWVNGNSERGQTAVFSNDGTWFLQTSAGATTTAPRAGTWELKSTGNTYGLYFDDGGLGMEVEVRGNRMYRHSDGTVMGHKQWWRSF